MTALLKGMKNATDTPYPENGATLQPYELVSKVIGTFSLTPTEREYLNVSWEALLDYTNAIEENAIAVVDTTASMNIKPMSVAISLGLYLSERATGPYKNHFINFHSTPKIIEVQGADFVSRVQNIREAEWCSSTNLEATFDLILDIAVRNGLTQAEMLDKLYIISDMQFDNIGGYGGRYSQRFFDNIRQRYANHGYEMPKLVFWEVNSLNNDNARMTLDERGFQNVSGFSPIIFNALMTGE